MRVEQLPEEYRVMLSKQSGVPANLGRRVLECLNTLLKYHLSEADGEFPKHVQEFREDLRAWLEDLRSKQ
jgi:hypothetical protein